MMRALATAGLVLALGCNDRAVVDTVGDGSGGASESTGTTTSSIGTSSGTTDGPVGSSGADSSEADTSACEPDEPDDWSGGGELDIGPGPPSCDLFQQDCELGSKCVPDEWIGTRACVPIAAGPVPDGQPCDAAADDPCGGGSWCGLADENGIGMCVPLCTGSFALPQCAPDTICVIDDEQITAFCQAPCDPFDPGACGRWSCQPTAQGFGCLPHGAHLRDEGCVQDDSCTDGLVCAERDASTRCCHGSCCTPLCDSVHPCDAGVCTTMVPPVPGASTAGRCLG